MTGLMYPLSRMRVYPSALAVLSLIVSACGPAAAPAPTTAAAPTVRAAPPTTAPAAQPTSAAAAPKPQSAVSNPPTTPEMVDAISLQGKNVEVTYWHNRSQQDQDLLQSMLDEFTKTNPYSVVGPAESAGAAYADV